MKYKTIFFSSIVPVIVIFFQIDNIKSNNLLGRRIDRNELFRRPNNVQKNTLTTINQIISHSIININPQQQTQTEDFEILFDGSNLDKWTGNKTGYVIENGLLTLHPDIPGGCCNLYTKKIYSDFNFQFDFKLSSGANNGIGIRTPLKGDAAYVGMEIQILDDYASEYNDLHSYQYHGSVYGVIPAKRGFLNPAGQWNSETIIAIGSHLKVILNGTIIVDGDIEEASKNGTIDGKDHPGLKNNSGHIGLLYHSTSIQFRNIKIKVL